MSTCWRATILSEEQSSVALWLLAAYPFAFFYGAVYTESLFLLSAAGAFYHLKHRQLVRAGLWGLMVGLTRANGCLVCVPLGLLAVSAVAAGAAGVRGRSAGGSRGPAPPLLPALAAAAMPCAGTLLYSAFVWSLTGNPLAWVVGHAAWGRRYTGLTALVTDRYAYIANAGVYGYVSQLPLDLLNAVGVVFVLATVWPVARRLGIAYAAFMLINILVPIADGGLLSAGRFSSVLFPAFHLAGERSAALATGPAGSPRFAASPGAERVAVLHVASVVLSGLVALVSSEGQPSICDGLSRSAQSDASTSRCSAVTY